MAIINQRWPRDLCPETCTFGRSRNDIRQVSVRTRKATTIRQGRPLWRAECSWSLPNTNKLAKLRYWLEQLDGFAGSVQLWDFASPYPFGLLLATGPDGFNETRVQWTNLATDYYWTNASLPLHWVYNAPVTLSANAAQGATSISLTGLQANKITCVQGQYVQVGQRIYIAASDVTSSGAGTATIPLQYGLLAAATSGETVRLVEAACEMQLADQNIDHRSRAGEGLTVVSASFLETVENL